MPNIVETHNLQVIGKPVVVDRKKPDADWTKVQIKEYMDKWGIEYNSGDTKGDLLDKALDS